MNWPTYQPYYPALVRLLQGVIYADDEKYWSLILTYRHEIEAYFLKIGLLLTIVEHDEFAYLRNLPRDEAPEGYAELPKLTRRRQLSFPVSLLCILLKKIYTQHQENVGTFEPPTVDVEELFESYQQVPTVARRDEWRGRQHFDTQFNKIKTDLRLVKETGIDDKTFRILPSINSLVTADFLDQTEGLVLGQSAAKAEQEVELDT